MSLKSAMICSPNNVVDFGKICVLPIQSHSTLGKIVQDLPVMYHAQEKASCRLFLMRAIASEQLNSGCLYINQAATTEGALPNIQQTRTLPPYDQIASMN